MRQRAPRDKALQLRLENQHWDQGWQNSYNFMARQLASDPSLRGSMSADSWNCLVSLGNLETVHFASVRLQYRRSPLFPGSSSE